MRVALAVLLFCPGATPLEVALRTLAIGWLLVEYAMAPAATAPR
jgi:hypothetical protein